MITRGVAEVHLLGEFLGHAAGCHCVDLRAEHHVPAHGRIKLRDRLDDLDRFADRGMLAAEFAHNREPEEAGVDQFIDHERRASTN
jgi:hypothetical protein